MDNRFSLTDSLSLMDFIWTLLWSVAIYFVFYRIVEGENLSMWFVFLGAFATKYAVSTITRLFLPDLSIPYNVYLEIGIYLILTLITINLIQ